jgi:endonuclease YncB( thermonuclease family)
MTFGPYPATVVSLHDGDTFRVDVDLGFGVHVTEFNVRVYGINAPELATAAGKAALAFAETLLKPGDRVTVLSHGWDKYAPRFDATVTLADGSDFGQRMLSAGQAVPMSG